MRRNNIQDALFHLTVFSGTEPEWPLVVVSGVSWSDKFRDDDLQAGVKACLPAEHGKQVSDGLVNPVDATTFLAHEEVMWAASKVGVADREGTRVNYGCRREMLAFATPAGHIYP